MICASDLVELATILANFILALVFSRTHFILAAESSVYMPFPRPYGANYRSFIPYGQPSYSRPMIIPWDGYNRGGYGYPPEIPHPYGYPSSMRGRYPDSENGISRSYVKPYRPSSGDARRRTVPSEPFHPRESRSEESERNGQGEYPDSPPTPNGTVDGSRDGAGSEERSAVIFPGPDNGHDDQQPGQDDLVSRDQSTASVNSGSTSEFEIVEPPDCANGSTYCEDIPNYPRDHLNIVLQVAPRKFKEMYGDDPNITFSTDSLPPRTDLLQEYPLCAALEHTIYPRVGKNKDDRWMYVVNHDQFVQGVRVEKCLRDSSPCLFDENEPLNVRSVCRQKYIYRKLLALQADGNTVTDSFRLPSCCVCHVKSNFIQDRFGPARPPNNRPNRRVRPPNRRVRPRTDD